MQKKGTYKLTDLLPVALIFVVSIIAISVGADIIDDIASDQCLTDYTWNETAGVCSNSSGGWSGGAGMSVAANASRAGLSGLLELGSWTPTLALVFAAALVIGVLVMSFAYGRS